MWNQFARSANRSTDYRCPPGLGMNNASAWQPNSAGFDLIGATAGSLLATNANEYTLVSSTSIQHSTARRRSYESCLPGSFPGIRKPTERNESAFPPIAGSLEPLKQKQLRTT